MRRVGRVRRVRREKSGECERRVGSVRSGESEDRGVGRVRSEEWGE